MPVAGTVNCCMPCPETLTEPFRLLVLEYVLFTCVCVGPCAPVAPQGVNVYDCCAKLNVVNANINAIVSGISFACFVESTHF